MKNIAPDPNVKTKLFGEFFPFFCKFKGNFFIKLFKQMILVVFIHILF